MIKNDGYLMVMHPQAWRTLCNDAKESITQYDKHWWYRLRARLIWGLTSEDIILLRKWAAWAPTDA